MCNSIVSKFALNPSVNELLFITTRTDWRIFIIILNKYDRLPSSKGLKMTDDANTAASNESLDTAAKSKKIVREEIKDRHTSHWDMDMMSRAELEALMTQKPVAKPE